MSTPTRLPPALIDAPLWTRTIAVNCPRLFVNVTALPRSVETHDVFFHAVCNLATETGATWAEVETCCLVSLRIFRLTGGKWSDVIRGAREMLTREESPKNLPLL